MAPLSSRWSLRLVVAPWYLKKKSLQNEVKTCCVLFRFCLVQLVANSLNMLYFFNLAKTSLISKNLQLRLEWVGEKMTFE